MNINVRRTAVDGEDLTGSEPASIMALEEPDVHFDHEVKYRLHAQLQGNALLVTGKLETPVRLLCSRCLKSFEKPLKVGLFVFHQELKGEDFVDLTANIREDIILELPQRALCTEKCKGLCLSCGKDLNKGVCKCAPSKGDLRWQALEPPTLK